MTEKELMKIIDNIPLEKWEYFYSVGWQTVYYSLRIVLVVNFTTGMSPTQDSYILISDTTTPNYQPITIKGYNYLVRKLNKCFMQKHKEKELLKIKELKL